MRDLYVPPGNIISIEISHVFKFLYKTRILNARTLNYTRVV